MSSTLRLRLEAPLQSWGLDGRFGVRGTEPEPTKSGVVGLLACALGIGRDGSLEDLVGLRMGVRVDRSGKTFEDFHLVRNAAGMNGKVLSDPVITRRWYLADASFLVGLEGEPGILSRVALALDHPVWPVYFGRKSCVPGRRVVDGLPLEQPLEEALAAAPWLARTKHEAAHPPKDLAYVIETNGSGDVVYDVPKSFAPGLREYTGRSVKRFSATLRSDLVVPDPLFRPWVNRKKDVACSSPK